MTEAPTVKMRQGKDGQSEVVTDRDGATQFVVVLFVKPRPNQSGYAGKGAEIKCTLETDPGDEVSEGDLVELINPRVSHWENELDGRMMSGLAWRATGIKPVA
ncbi:hypothetical protein [Actinophytocola sp. NPDC049390]|uniref:hypothetical protein n=1 Tax=Actinophytocola sp. NPDC049390 TaxID=3363894 RepID=UPI0037A5FC1C